MGSGTFQSQFEGMLDRNSLAKIAVLRDEAFAVEKKLSCRTFVTLALFSSAAVESEKRMTEFGVNRDQLKFLIRDRDSDSLSRIAEVGGVAEIGRKLHVETSTGILSSREDMKTRTTLFGVNFVPPPKPRSYFSFLKDAFGDLTILILCVSALVDLGIAIGYAHTTSSFAESAAILISIVVVTNVAASNDYRKQSQFRKLNAVVDNMEVLAVRDGRKVSIPTNDIVVGDIVSLSVGDIICADGLLIDGHGVQTDESSLTGETKSIKKSVAANPFLLSGTKVMEGTGSFLVIAVGENSEAGQIRMIVQGGRKDSKNDERDDSETAEIGEVKSVLTNKLDSLATNIGKAGTVVAVVCFLVMMIRFCVTRFALVDPETECAVIGGAFCADQAVLDLNSGAAWPLCSSGLTCCVDTASGAAILGSPCPWLKTHIGDFIGFFITSVTILVVAVPEGLPLAVTLALAFSVIKMQSDNNLVKHLDACETMGSATTVCSDKTGTLTKNRMTVMRAFVGGESFKPAGAMPVGVSVLGFVETDWNDFEAESDGQKKIPKYAVRGSVVAGGVLRLLAEGISINSTGDIRWDAKTKLWEQIGNKTECALLQFVSNLGFSYADQRQELTEKIVFSVPFNSTKKRSTLVVRDGDMCFNVHVKGASEMVLDLCTSIMTRSGDVRSLTPDDTVTIQRKISEYASLAMRTICVAYKPVASGEHDWEQLSDPADESSYLACESGLVLLAIVGIEDPLRDEVPAAILKCRAAGVDVRMVTGDNLDTAIAIAKGCGILRSSDLDSSGNPKTNCAMTGPDFRKRVILANGKIDQAEFDLIWPSLRVLARSSPTDKFTLVSGLGDSELFASERGRRLRVYPDRQVVAVTGDGTNDAPALKKADVGFAMGITGTAVAKEAADIILLDDNFSSIVKAIMWGRNVHEGIAKFLQFQLTINIVALVLAVEGSLMSSESPLKAVQMLWVNLIMDSLASLALATEMPTEEHLQRPPIGRNKSMISTIMTWNIVGHVAYQLTVLNVIYFAGPSIFGFESGTGQGHAAKPSQHNTLLFNTFVLIQLFNQINSRKLHHEVNLFKGLFSSRIFMAIFFVEFGVQAIIVQFGDVWFHTSPLSYVGWLVGIACGLLVFPVQWIIVWMAAMVDRVMAARSVVVTPLAEDAEITISVPKSARRNSQELNAGGLHVAGTLVKTKRNETSKTLARTLTREGDELSKKKMLKAGADYQKRRKSAQAFHD